jgi:NAD(P)H dehydrogenase (quinone)
MTTYAITGVTGHFGQAAVKVLAQLVPANDIVALARNTEKAQGIVPAGVTVRPGDYTKPEQLRESLAGVDRLLFISSQPGAAMPRTEQHENVVNAAKAAGVQFIAYTSFPHAATNDMPLAADHKLTEQLIKESGLQYAFLRNNWYLQNEAATLNAAAAGHDFVYSAGAGKAGWALEREYAEGAVKVLVMDKPQPVYEFAGQARTYKDLADAMTGDFKVQSVDDAAYKQGLLAAGLDEGTADLVTGFQAMIRAGQLDENTTDLPDVLGHALTPIADAIKEVVGQ